jgi:tRNA U34 5-carboxymethylaminomethyl modifying enzyme MnmG/GidA
MLSLEDKKKEVYRLVRLNMTREEAELLADCTLDEQIELAADELYLAKCKFYVMYEEKMLMESIDRIIAENELKGVSTEIRWKLEKLNPAKYGKTVAISGMPSAKLREMPDVSKLNAQEREALIGVANKVLNGAKDE